MSGNAVTEIMSSDGKTLKLKTFCPFCHKGQIIVLTDDKINSYYNGLAKHNAGAPVQKAWPMFTPDEREFLLTGICPECWDSM